MSLASNLVNTISKSQIGAKQITAAPDFDLNDKTFSNILDKQMEGINDVQKNENSQKLGIPNGFTIDELISMQQIDNKTITAQNSTEAVNPINFDDLISKNEESEISNSEMLGFFTSLFDKHANFNNNNVIYNFARKQASNFYGRCAGNVVTDLAEFVTDALKIS